MCRRGPRGLWARRGGRRFGLLPLIVAVALSGAVAACGVGSTRASSGDTSIAPLSTVTTGMHWGRCTSSYKGRYECGTLQVPLDHANPAGAQLTLALIRTAASGSKLGSLLINPGGPGASALSSWDFLSSQTSAALRKHFDLIGFDPRGVGASTAVHCATSAELDQYTQLDFSPTTNAAATALQNGAKALAQGCVARSGALLPFVGTADSAKDMDDIRQAVGDPKLSYLGYSYGTFLGAQYANEFPTHVRAMVLDGALDPSTPVLASVDQQSQAFQAQLDAFLQHCATTSCGWKFRGDPHGALRALVAKVDAGPVPAAGDRRLYAGQLFFGIGTALYDRANWKVLEQALQGVSTGDASLMLRLADAYTERQGDGSYANLLEANLAINCRDYAWPREPAAFLAAARASASVAPDFGPDNLDTTLACAYFPAADSGAAFGPFTAAGSPPIVVVATTGDPATPYVQGVALAKELSRGVLVTNVGEQHTAYGYSACVRSVADAYLLNLTAPKAGTRCDDE